MSQDAFRETNRVFEEVFVTGDFGALAQVYTEGARLLSPGVPMITGLPGIIEYWKGAAAALGVTGVRLHTLDLAVTGDRAAELGRAEIHTGSGAAPVRVKYVVLWTRAGGAWKWDVDCWNMDA